MRLLLNENIPGLVVEALRRRGYDVCWVREEAPGIADTEVLRRATAEERLLVTCDKDFGELAFRYGLPAGSGIVLFRSPARSPQEFAQIAAAVLQSRSDWAGCFSVIERNRIRMTPLPGRQG